MTTLRLRRMIERGCGIDDLCAAAGLWSDGFRAWAKAAIWAQHDFEHAKRNREARAANRLLPRLRAIEGGQAGVDAAGRGTVADPDAVQGGSRAELAEERHGGNAAAERAEAGPNALWDR